MTVSGTVGRVAWSRRWPSARSPDRVPSRTGMPRARSCAASGWSIADERFDSTTTGLSVCSTSRPIALGNDSSPSNSGTRSTASATTSTASSSASAARLAEQLVLGAVAGSPDVERVRGLQARVEQRGQPVDGRLRQGCERDAEPLGHVGHEHPLRPGVVDGRDAAARTAYPSADGEALQAVGQLAEVVRPVHAVRREQRLPARVRARDRAGVGVDQDLAAGRDTDRGRDHGDVALGGLGQAGPQAGRVAQGLEHQPDRPGSRAGTGRTRGSRPSSS